ncbi:MAG: hypothetical protein O7A03_05820 [Alphaproteobacteria bacterium]|nr:hypothetical protein [Alphaproteobacteria bacterium]
MSFGNPVPQRDLDIRAALGKGAAVLFGDIRLFVIIAAVIYSPLFGWTVLTEPTALETEEDWDDLLGVAISALLLQLLVAGAVAHATALLLLGRTANVLACLTTALERFFTVLGITLFQLVLIGVPMLVGLTLVSTGAAIGAVVVFAAVIGGLFILAVWWVAIPACVIEGHSVRHSLERSAELTGGYRWKVLGLVLSIGLISISIQMILAALTMPGEASLGFVKTMNLISAGVTALIATFAYIVAAVTFHELRTNKQGGTTPGQAVV